MCVYVHECRLRSKRLGRRRWRKSWDEIVAGSDGRTHARIRAHTNTTSRHHQWPYWRRQWRRCFRVCLGTHKEEVPIKRLGVRGTPSFCSHWTALNAKTSPIVCCCLSSQSIIREGGGGGGKRKTGMKRGKRRRALRRNDWQAASRPSASLSIKGEECGWSFAAFSLPLPTYLPTCGRRMSRSV